MDDGTLADTALAKQGYQVKIYRVTNHTAQQAYDYVLKNAGAVMPKRDTLDQRIISDVINGTGRIIDVQGGFPAFTDTLFTKGAWPTLESLPPAPDGDHDGMANEWEWQRDLDSLNATDRNGISPNRYTHLENFLNGDSIVAFGTPNTCVAAKPVFASNTNKWLELKDTTFTRLISTDTMNVIASIRDNGNFGLFNASYFVTNTTRFDGPNRPYLNRNITITPATPAAITSPVTVRIYITKKEFLALQAADNSISTINDLRIFKSPGSSCVPSLSGQSTLIVPTATGVYGTYQNGYYLEFTTSSFSTFFVVPASVAPLPVDLLSFTAAYRNGQVDTKWATAQEVNLSHFEIERSRDGQNFNFLSRVNATNSLQDHNYSFSDMNPFKGLSYYRLKMQDKDGKFKYSNIVAVQSGNNTSLSISPNPVQNVFTISYPQLGTEASIWLFSTDGKQVLQQKLAPGSSASLINVQGIAAGMYELILINGDEKKSIKFVKQ